MSKIKNEYVAGDHQGNEIRALCGTRYPFEVWLVWLQFTGIMKLEAAPGDNGSGKALLDYISSVTGTSNIAAGMEESRKNVMLHLEAEIRHAIAARDGTFFKRLGELFDDPEAALQPDEQRLWLLTNCFKWKQGEVEPEREQSEFLTLAELTQRVRAAGHVVEEKRVWALCREMGIKLKQGKRGRPKGKYSAATKVIRRY